MTLAAAGAVFGKDIENSQKPHALKIRLVTNRSEELTSIQTSRAYRSIYDFRCDAAMVYGKHDFPGRIKGWRQKDFVTHFMTGSSWGSYGDFLKGQWNGTEHWDHGQVDGSGAPIMHGRETPYMVPSVAFSDYLTEIVKKAIDEGALAVHLEEPEFWARSGYGGQFKKQWQAYYGTQWRRGDSDVQARYDTARLQYYLYQRHIRRIAEACREYALAKHDRQLRVYVPTHSLINYTQWRIVSPESSLVNSPVVDGFIAQIWTGTSRSPNKYNGVIRERTFETAFLEYGVMQELVRGTGKRMWFLHDPIEDNPQHDWDDYRENYICTLVASLLQPEVWRYEICPWPSRVITRKYPRDSKDGKYIPGDYATTLAVVFNQLRDMKQQDVDTYGSTDGVGLLLGDSSMFQRANPAFKLGLAGNENDPLRQTEHESYDWLGFFGMALPLVKDGVFVRTVQLDNIGRFAGYLEDFKVLILSYELQKPESPGLHQELANWVAGGGSLVYIGAETDPFHKVAQWWNTGDNDFESPAEHLMLSLGLEKSCGEGAYKSGKGRVFVLRKHPAYYSRSEKASGQLREVVKKAAAAAGIEYRARNYFKLRRGPYVVAACLEESTSEQPLVFDGSFVDLLDRELSVLSRVELGPGEKGFYIDLDRLEKGKAMPLACAGRIESINTNDGSIKMLITSTENVQVVTRIYLPAAPKSVSVNGKALSDYKWHLDTSTLFVTLPGAEKTEDTLELSY